MTFDDRTPDTPGHPDTDGAMTVKNFFALTVLGSVYLLGVSGLRFLSFAICSAGGCPDDGLWGGGWENQTVAVLVVLAITAMVVAARVAARAQGRGSIDDNVRTTAWFAVFTVVLFAVPSSLEAHP